MVKVRFSHIFLFTALLLLLLASSASVSAGLTLSTERSEYYFPLSKPAQLIINVSNTEGVDLAGIMSYTSSQKVQTSNTVMQSSNSNSQQFTIPKDMTSFGVGLGSSSSPAEIDLSLTFNFKDKNGTEQQTTLDGIKVFFVDDKNQNNSQQQNQNQQNQQNEQNQQNQQNQNSQQKQSTTQSQDDLKKQYQQQQDEAQKQMEQQMEEQMRRQQEASKLGNRIQNNQQAQDSNALKQQMEKDLAQKQQLQNEFQKSLEQNKEFQKQMSDVMQSGYNQTGAELNPENNNSGDFKVNFQDKFGNNLTLHGNMNSSKITDMSTDMKYSLDYIKSLVQADPRYTALNSKLINDHFTQGNWSIESDGNTSIVSIEYSDGKSNNTMLVEMQGTKILSVKLKKTSDFLSTIAIVLIIVILLSALIFYLYKKNKPVSKPKHEIHKEVEEKFDHLGHSRKLIEQAKKSFSQKEYKDAYSLASQAIRIFYSYEVGLKKEITNHDLIAELKRKSIAYKDTQKCLNMCSMVEFARYTANKDDFDEIIKLAESIIK